MDLTEVVNYVMMLLTGAAQAGTKSAAGAMGKEAVEKLVETLPDSIADDAERRDEIQAALLAEPELAALFADLMQAERGQGDGNVEISGSQTFIADEMNFGGRHEHR